jgi:23S rRNA U2552 (ribose-2'-O)-methylase RlmE/FtsJ
MSKIDNVKLDLAKIPVNYLPVIHNITGTLEQSESEGQKADKRTTTNDIFKSKTKPEFSTNIDYPKFSLGFHHYIHQSKDKMEITSQFEGKKKIYYVLNKFERYVDDYENDINNVSKMYFDIGPKPNILSRAFYKLWEMLFLFDLVQIDKPNLVSAHLAEGPGSFIQATMFFRDKYCKKGISKSDQYHAITLHSEDVKKHVPPLEESFIKYYEKEKPQRFMQHKTYPKELAGGSYLKDNGDLTDPKTINLFGGNFNKQKADFVTADGGFNWVNENTQEQEAFKLILAQIITALKVQAVGGNFVCKFFETFTESSVKLIVILKVFYEEVYAIKPLMSRQSNSEKYFVCKKFKNDKSNDKNIIELESVLKLAMKYKDMKIISLFPDFNIENDFKAQMIKINTDISNQQFILINRMVDFIQKQNYRGDVYQTSREEQIKATDFWTNTFFPQVTDFTESKKQLEKLTQDIIGMNNDKINAFKKQII